MQHDNPLHGVSEHGGFPNPGTDTSLEVLSLDQLLIANRTSTYIFRVRGDDWHAQGIFDGDIVLIDRALSVRKQDTVLWWDERATQFVLSLRSAVRPDATIWGVATSVIHPLRPVPGQRPHA